MSASVVCSFLSAARTRVFTVPNGTPVTAAICTCVRPPRYHRSTTCRCALGNVSTAECTADASARGRDHPGRSFRHSVRYVQHLKAQPKCVAFLEVHQVPHCAQHAPASVSSCRRRIVRASLLALGKSLARYRTRRPYYEADYRRSIARTNSTECMFLQFATRLAGPRLASR